MAKSVNVSESQMTLRPPKLLIKTAGSGVSESGAGATLFDAYAEEMNATGSGLFPTVPAYEFLKNLP